MATSRKNPKKGKIHHPPSRPSSPSPSSNPDAALAVLQLLPAAIVALAAALSAEDREVLAYLMLANPCSSTVDAHGKKKFREKSSPPIFQCGCFDCYMSYWARWDRSPNRDLIHRAIEAFEDQPSAAAAAADGGQSQPPAQPQPPGAPLSSVQPTSVPEKEVLEAKEEAAAAVEKRVQVAAVGNHHKGLARKVLPDVVGLLNSRFWSLWSPSIY